MSAAGMQDAGCMHAAACLDGVREGHRDMAQADIGEQVAQRVHGRQRQDAQQQVSVHFGPLVQVQRPHAQGQRRAHGKLHARRRV